MADKNSRWSWNVKGFEPKTTTSFDVTDHQSRTSPISRRYPISSSILPPSEFSKHATGSKLRKLEDKLKVLL
ncbi:Kinesin-like protein KIN-14A [Bienertia sinuspersici]